MAHLGEFDQQGTHRLIPTAYATESVLESLSLPANVISDLTELDAATNERKVAERGGNAAISPGELLYGVPEAHIVNAAFTHPGPHGGRFNDSRRGAWYAGVKLETSINEVAFHKRRFLKEVGSWIVSVSTMRISWLTSQDSSISSMSRSANSVFNLIQFLSATVHRRRWPIHFCTPDRVASYTQVFVIRAEPALHAFGRLSSSIRVARSSTASQ